MNKTLDWLKSQELPTAGIAAWPGYQAYPEVSGYSIPTLCDYNEFEFAGRCADWLISTQKPNGSWAAMNGLFYTFDVAAIIEGLERAYTEFRDKVYGAAAQRGREWLKNFRRPDGFYRIDPGNLNTAIHGVRVNWIMHDDPHRFQIARSSRERSHYIAYGLEGYLGLGYKDDVTGILKNYPFYSDGLAPMWIENGRDREGTDVIATSQLAILKIKCGLDAAAQVAAVHKHVRADGSVPQSAGSSDSPSWGAKWVLDLEKVA